MATKKVFISLDEELIERLDEAAGERGISRSAYASELFGQVLRAIRGGQARMVAPNGIVDVPSVRATGPS